MYKYLILKSETLSIFFFFFNKKRSIAFQIPARMGQPAPLNSKDIRVLVSLASEEKHVKVSQVIQ